MPRWSWAGVIVLVMSIAISVAWAVSVTVLVVKGQPISDQVGSALNGIGGALVAMVAGYLGWHRRERHDDEGA